MNRRIKLCLENIEKKGYDGFLVSNPINISYLSGFRNAEGFLLLNKVKPIYFTNFLYNSEAKNIDIWKTKLCPKDIFNCIVEEIFRLKLKNVAFESKHLTYLEYKKLKEVLIKKHINFSPLSDVIENIRAIKEESEIILINKAIKISLEGFKFIEEIVVEKMTEKDLLVELERFLKIKGDYDLAFSPIIAFGKNTSLPHHIPEETKLKNNKLFLVDLGAKYQRYCADLTRVFFWGKMPNYLKKIYDIIRKSKDLAIRKIKEGVRAKDVDKTAREFIENKGFGKYFGHGLGHGLGMAVHEEPYLNPHSKTILKEGMVITIEPAVYIPGKFGIRLEDIVLVKSNKGETLSNEY
ncbi:MAG: Xaa-Pro peptidase family protein [Candidatus Omnitrophica bacterium]|nr:Xaa-Pro peptidase family protein [Candidatus Omnitrophota bacterium]